MAYSAPGFGSFVSSGISMNWKISFPLKVCVGGQESGRGSSPGQTASMKVPLSSGGSCLPPTLIDPAISKVRWPNTITERCASVVAGSGWLMSLRAAGTKKAHGRRGSVEAIGSSQKTHRRSLA